MVVRWQRMSCAATAAEPAAAGVWLGAGLAMAWPVPAVRAVREVVVACCRGFAASLVPAAVLAAAVASVLAGPLVPVWAGGAAWVRLVEALVAAGPLVAGAHWAGLVVDRLAAARRAARRRAARVDEVRPGTRVVG